MTDDRTPEEIAQSIDAIYAKQSRMWSRMAWVCIVVPVAFVVIVIAVHVGSQL